jgi:hypothetical protein
MSESVGASPAFPEVSPFSPDSLHPSPQGHEMPNTQQTVNISAMTAPLDAQVLRSGQSSSSSPSDDVPFTPDPADKWVALSQLAEGVKAAQVREQCIKFGAVLKVFIPRRRAHPVFGVTAFVRFESDEVALHVVKAFKEADYTVDYPAAPPPQKPRRSRGSGGAGNGGGVRRASYTSLGTSDTGPSRAPITIDEIKRRGEERLRQQQRHQGSSLPPQHR